MSDLRIDLFRVLLQCMKTFSEGVMYHWPFVEKFLINYMPVQYGRLNQSYICKQKKRSSCTVSKNLITARFLQN